jgi:hypothetical protein
VEDRCGAEVSVTFWDLPARVIRSRHVNKNIRVGKGTLFRLKIGSYVGLDASGGNLNVTEMLMAKILFAGPDGRY